MSKFLTILHDGKLRIPVEGASITGAGKVAGLFRDDSDVLGPDPDNDVDSIVDWDSLSSEDQIIAQYNSGVLSRGEDCARFELRKLEIDDQGYDDSGCYWGTPSNLWSLVDNDDDDCKTQYFRADSPGAALEYAKYHFEADQDLILVTIPGASDNDFTI